MCHGDPPELGRTFGSRGRFPGGVSLSWFRFLDEPGFRIVTSGRGRGGAACSRARFPRRLAFDRRTFLNHMSRCSLVS